MPPAKKSTAAKRSSVMGGVEDEVIASTPPTEAADADLSSRAKDKLFGDPPKDADGVRPAQDGAAADKPADAVQTELVPEAPPERHESGSYEQEHSDLTVEAADFDAEEKVSGE